MRPSKMVVILAQQFTMRSKCNLICIFSLCADQHHFSFSLFNVCWLAGLPAVWGVVITNKPKTKTTEARENDIKRVCKLHTSNAMELHTCIQQKINTRWSIRYTLACTRHCVSFAHTFFSSLRIRYDMGVTFSHSIRFWYAAETPTKHSWIRMQCEHINHFSSPILFVILYKHWRCEPYLFSRDVTWKMVAIWSR